MLIWNVREERSYALRGAFRTPKRGATVMFLPCPIERSWLCSAYRRQTALKIVLRRERTIHLSGLCNRFPYLSPQPLYILEA